ncbi:MAG: SUMF1/EgtB/PvdO family nonheme iron enzyme [bacterium]|nr:SUMF1/EgtB/PvdO family nonheme iron enzyme [bacterium]
MDKTECQKIKPGGMKMKISKERILGTLFFVLVLFSVRADAGNPVPPKSPASPAVNKNTPQIGKEYASPGGKGGPMLYIPAGEFLMGCNAAVDNQCKSDEKPYHLVNLSAYYIDKYDVTVDDYAKCVKEKQCKIPDTFQYCNWGKPDRGKYPINCAEWNHAQAYCQWAGKRLPTEAEWEKAARGTDGRKYPWGNQAASCEYAVMSAGGDGCSKDQTWPVGSKPSGASPYGVIDMAGNVWNWVQDWYEKDYSKSLPQNPTGPSSGASRVARGGSWELDPSYLRSSARNVFNPGSRHPDSGFRCVYAGPNR